MKTLKERWSTCHPPFDSVQDVRECVEELKREIDKDTSMSSYNKQLVRMKIHKWLWI